jgi:hypothetical protein
MLARTMTMLSAAASAAGAAGAAGGAAATIAVFKATYRVVVLNDWQISLRNELLVHHLTQIGQRAAGNTTHAADFSDPRDHQTLMGPATATPDRHVRLCCAN